MTDESGDASGSTKTTVVSNKKQFGFSNSLALNLGTLWGDHVDLGIRFAGSGETSKFGSDATSPESSTSSLALTPYVAYLGGHRGAAARFTIGALAGVGTGSIETTYPSATDSSYDTPKTTESTLHSTEYGAFIGLRAFPGDVFSIDPILMLTHKNLTWIQPALPDVKLSGTSLMLNISFTYWIGGGPAPEGEMAAPGSNTTSIHPAAVGSHASPSQSAPSSALDRVTLPLSDERAATFIVDRTAAEPTVLLVLRDSPVDRSASSCRQVNLHVPNYEDVAIDVQSGMATSGSSRFPIFKAKVAVEQIRHLGSLPVRNGGSGPDHWFDVCGQHWEISEDARVQLRHLLDTLPAGAPAPANAPAQSAPSDRITLPLSDERAITVIFVRNSAEPTLLLVLRDGATDTNTNSCRQVTLHAPNHEDLAMQVQAGMATSGASRFPILRTKVPVEQIRFMGTLPVNNPAATPDHWIDVCGRRWEIPENGRAQLKEYLNALPASVPLAAPNAPLPSSESAPAASPIAPDPLPAPGPVPAVPAPADATAAPTTTPAVVPKAPAIPRATAAPRQ